MLKNRKENIIEKEIYIHSRKTMSWRLGATGSETLLTHHYTMAPGGKQVLIWWIELINNILSADEKYLILEGHGVNFTDERQ